MDKRKENLQKYSKIKPDQKQVLLEIERFTNAEIPDYNNVTSENYGIVLERRNVIHLALYNSEIKLLPESIGNLTSLRRLFLGRNKIESIPKTIGNLKQLKILDLNNNHIDSLPKEIGELGNLRKLNLKNNNLSTIPNEIGELGNLRILNLKNNNLSTIPESINKLTKIERINLDGNEIISYPDVCLGLDYDLDVNQVRALLNLEKEINIKIPCREKLSDFDVRFLKNEKKIICLCLNNCDLIELPSSIRLLKNLKYLFLSHNKFSNLPEFIGDLEKLEYLDLHENKLISLPSQIKKLNSLKEISLYGNKLEEIPDPLYSLKTLKVLDLRNNNLQIISNKIKGLKNLDQIEFSGNPIKKVSTPVLKKKYNLKANDAKSLWKVENFLSRKVKKLDKIKPSDFGYISKKREIVGLALFNCGLEVLPVSICRLKSLEILYLGGNYIEEIPDYVEFMQKLVILDISKNSLSRISNKIGEIPRIKELYLNNNLINNIPSTLGKLKKLNKLFLHENRIKKISNELKGLKSKSVEVKLDWLKIEFIPDYIALGSFGLILNDLRVKLKLEKLIKRKIPKINSLDFKIFDLCKIGYEEIDGCIEILILRHLGITKLPHYLTELKRLRVLYLDGNNLLNLPGFIFDLKKISKLNLAQNYLTRISEKIKNFENLIWLDLSNNRLNAIPRELFNNLNLKYLNLRNNNINEIPNEFPNNLSLVEINLRNNPIINLPDSLSSIKTLKKLNIEWDNLKSIPEDFLKFQYAMEKKQALFIRGIKNLIQKDFSIKEKIRFNTRGYKKNNGNIVKLCLYNCNLTEIPESIGNLVYLQKLFLNKNQLKSLPQSIKNLSELNTLNIRNNKFERLTPELYYLNKLKKFQWQENNWEEESLQTINRGVEYIRDYCKEIILIDIFLSHKYDEFQPFHIKEIAEYLESQEEINNVYYCEDDLVGNIDHFMEKYVPDSDILVLFGSRNSIYNSEDCEKEIKLAKENEKLILTVKGDDIGWSDFSKYKLERDKGIDWRGEDKFSEFLEDLYNEILKLKREYANQIIN